MTTINFPFTTPANYTYDTDKIEVTGGVAKLKLQEVSQNFTEDFADDTDFTYDSAKAEFVGGKIRQIDRAPDAMFFATYQTSIDLDYGTGSLTGTATGGAAISGNRLDLAHSDVRHVKYTGITNATSLQQGAVKLKYTPNYSGSPSGDRTFFYMVDVSGNKNLTFMRHRSSGQIQLLLYDQNGASLLTVDIGAWSPTSGTTYEIELNYDIDPSVGGNTAVRIFIDGVQLGSTQTGFTGTRSASLSVIKVGTNLGGTDQSNFYIEDLIIMSQPQHTANYTPGYTLASYRYEASTATLPEMEHAGDGTIKAFNTFSTTEAGAPRYTIQIGRSGNYLYWNGSAWATSDGTYAQANDATTFNTQCGSLPVSGENYGQFKIHFDDSQSTQSEVDELTANMDIDKYATDNPTITVNSTFRSTALESFSTTETKTGSDEIKYIIDASGQARYVTGGSAANSDGTYAQSSTQTEMSSDIENIISARKNIQLKIFLHSNDGQTTPEIDLASFTYDYAIDDPTLPTLVNVEGFIYDKDGPISNLTIQVRPYLHGFWNEGVFHKYAWENLATTDTDGYFEGEMYLQPSGEYWEFKIGNQRYYAELLDQEDMDLKDAPKWEVVEVG